MFCGFSSGMLLNSLSRVNYYCSFAVLFTFCIFLNKFHVVECLSSVKNVKNSDQQHETELVCLTHNKNDCISSPVGSILIYGGKGIFGSFLVDFFRERNYFVASVDFEPNDSADLNIIIPSNLTLEQKAYIVSRGIPDALKFNAIICTMSGWSGGKVDSKSFLQNAKIMIEENIWSSLIAASLAPNFLQEHGILILTGGQRALKPTPSMITYGAAKQFIHQLVRSLGAEGSGLPFGAKAYAILPATVSSKQKQKRKQKNTHKDIWSPLKDLAKTILSWVSLEFRPPSGTLIQFLISDEKTDIIISN